MELNMYQMLKMILKLFKSVRSAALNKNLDELINLGL